MSVQFRLNGSDHKVVEDFLARNPRSTSAITLDSKASKHQSAAAEAAREAGIDVYYEPATERLATAGFGLERYPCFAGTPYDIDALAVQANDRSGLVDRVVGAHPALATHVTAPHFYVDDERPLLLNIALAEATRLQSQLPVRAILTVSHAYVVKHAQEIAAEYVRAGITHIELRLSPVGGEDQSVKKVRDTFAVAAAFTAAGLQVTLGQSGNIGQVAVANGSVAAYSVGVGMLEQVNHKTVVNRQSKEPKPRTEEDPGGGPQAGVYLPGLAATVTNRTARALLDLTDVRTRIGCRLGTCGDSLRGPVDDARGHYLHARDNEMAVMLDKPSTVWRTKSERDRLHAAANLRRLVNDRHRSDDVREIKTRTLTSLIQTLQPDDGASSGSATSTPINRR